MQRNLQLVHTLSQHLWSGLSLKRSFFWSFTTLAFSLGCVCVGVCVQWQTAPVFLPGEPHGQRNQEDCGPWGHTSRTRLGDWTTTTALWMFKRFFLCVFFFTRTIFKAFIEFVTISFLFFVLFFWLQGTWDLNLPDRGLYPHPLHWKAES